MAIEAIKSIKQCEENGNELVTKAQLEAKDIIKKAKSEADKHYENTLKDARDERNKILSQAEEEGKNIANPIIAQCEQEAEAFCKIDGIKKEKAVKLIYERIVKSHGNS